MYRNIFIALFSLGILLASSWVKADLVTLKNGDRISGTVIRKDKKALVFKTSYAGEIKISWDEIAGLTTDKAVEVMMDNDEILDGVLLPAESGEMRLQTNEKIETASLSLEKIKYINPPPEISGKGVKYSGRVNIGASAARGNSTNNRLHSDAEFIARTKKNRYALGGSFNYASDSNTTTESNAFGYMKYDRFFTKKWYGYANSTLQNDRLQDIRLRTTLGIGPGYQIFESEETNLSLEGGLSYVYVDRTTQPNESYPAARLAVAFDHFLFDKSLQFFTADEAFQSLDNVDNLFIRTQTGLRMPLPHHLAATTQVNVDWNNNPAPGKVSTDRSVIFSLGYAW